MDHLLSGLNPRPPHHPKPYGVVDADGVLWNASTVGTFTTPEPGIETAYDVVIRACERFSSQQGFGKRALLQRHYEMVQGKEVEKLTFADEYTWMTYGEYRTALHALGGGMVKFARLKPGDHVVIYAETQLDWMLSCIAAFSQSLVVVTVYATLGEEGLAHGVKQTKAKLIIADSKLLPKVSAAARKHKESMGNCNHVIAISDPVQTPDPKNESVVSAALRELTESGWKSQTLDEAIANAGIPPNPPKAEDTAVVMYTSGTTGLPKGVIITHANIVSCASGFVERMMTFFDIKRDGPKHVYLGYLPLAHIMEIALEIMVISVGMQVGYGSPHTLTSTGVKIKTGTCQGDAAVLGPTLLAFAPAVLDKVYAALNAKIAGSSKLVQMLFKWGLASGESNFNRGVVGANWLYNKLVFKKVQALLGGRLVFAGTGSAPLSPKVQAFVQTAFNAPCRQGYGLTETCAATCVQMGCDNTTGAVGPPTPSACIKLKDWEEGNYKNADLHNPEVGMRRGEVLIGGPLVCSGYLVDPDDPDADVVQKNKEEFSVDEKGVRWFHTGDIGQFTPDGNLQIIDRKKDLVKLQQGEYVALSKVENALKACPLVEMPMCYARSSESYCVALVCPVHAGLLNFAKELGIASTDVAGLCSHPKVVAEVTTLCQRAVKGKLVGFEIPKKIGLVAEPWTPENDMLTAAMKLKRVPIVNRHKAELDALYS
mmetsp:Transcript_24026/g.50395  ORF Transcript_24026/g.50395 Transcript_24026/m.50395 type:complete len:711 (-) Transcript_24026:693-2825(-)